MKTIKNEFGPWVDNYTTCMYKRQRDMSHTTALVNCSCNLSHSNHFFVLIRVVTTHSLVSGWFLVA